MSGYSDRKDDLRHAEVFYNNRAPKPARTQSRWQSAKNAAEGVAVVGMLRNLIRSIF
jgi:hypothetical protein